MLAGGSLAGLVLLAGCAQDAPQDTWHPAGPNAQKIDDLQKPVFFIAGIVGLIVFGTVGYCIFKYRDRGQDIPEQTHGKPWLEIMLTIIPAVILLFVGVFTVSTVFALAKTSDTQCIVNVTGQQWWWEYDYPVQDGCLPGGIDTPIVTSGELVIPAQTRILLHITSRDVIHSFWIPKLNGKRDAVPGRDQTLRMEADQPGMYAGPVHRVLWPEPRPDAHGRGRPEQHRLRDVGGQPGRRVHPARRRHARRDRAGHLRRPVLALPSGQRSHRRRRRCVHPGAVQPGPVRGRRRSCRT